MVPDGATITAGGGTKSITVSYGSNFTSGFIEVAAANDCGQSSSMNPSRISVQATLATPTAINGDATGLCKRTGVVYSIITVPGATSYTWMVPGGATIVSGQGTTSVTVNYGTAFSGGTICVKANNACGSSTSSCKAVSALPSIPAAISGLASVCAKQAGVVYSIAAVSGATSYTWTVPSLAKITSGQGTNSITVTFAAKGGDVTVVAKNTCGSATRSLPVSVITCSKTSVSSIGQLEMQVATQEPVVGIRAYPNPVKDIVQLEFAAIPDGMYTLTVVDGIGKLVRTFNLAVGNNRATVNLSGLAKGIYFLHLTDGKKGRSVKVIHE
jgi:hypothetical protein